MSRIKKYDIECQVHFLSGNVYHRHEIFARKLNSKDVQNGKDGWVQVHYNHRFCSIFIENLKFYRNKYKFRLIAYVIMPDHYHLLIQPMNDIPVSKIRQSFKGFIAHEILTIVKTEWDQCFLNRFKATETSQRNRDARYHIFQADDYDFNIYSFDKLREKIVYIHNNPVVQELVEYAKDYEYSSARNYELEDHSLVGIDPIDMF